MIITNPVEDPLWEFILRNIETPVLYTGDSVDTRHLVGPTLEKSTVRVDDLRATPWQMPPGQPPDTIVVGEEVVDVHDPVQSIAVIAEAFKHATRAVVVILPQAKFSRDHFESLLRPLPTSDYDIVYVPSRAGGIFWAAFIRVDGGRKPALQPSRLPRMSVLLMTYRPGGLDVALSGLSRQDYPGEWEVVMVDELQPSKARREALRLALDRWPVPQLRHVRNERSIYPRCSTSRAHNQGIVSAEGDIAIWMADYMAVRPDFVRQHAALHQALGAGYVVNGALYPSWAPRLDRALGPPPLDPFDEKLHGRVSIFEHPFEAHSAWLLPLMGKTHAVDDDPDKICENELWARTILGLDYASMHFPDGVVDQGYYFMKHDSVGLDLLRRVQGGDEQYDGLHACHDSEMAARLDAAGAVFYHSKRPAARIVQVRHVMHRLKQLKIEVAQKQGYDLLAETRRRVEQGDFLPVETHPELRAPA